MSKVTPPVQDLEVPGLEVPQFGQKSNNASDKFSNYTVYRKPFKVDEETGEVVLDTETDKIEFNFNTSCIKGDEEFHEAILNGLVTKGIACSWIRSSDKKKEIIKPSASIIANMFK